MIARLPARPSLQRRARGAERPEVTPAGSRRTLDGSGQPLDRESRRLMESRLGHDFSRVRVHTDQQTAVAAASLGALAFVQGQDIGFAAGQYQPATRRGTLILAHELVHVVQRQNSVARSVGAERTADAEAEATTVVSDLATHGRATSIRQGVSPGAILRVATDPVAPVLPTVTLHHGVGRGRPNDVADVQAVQDRLEQLNYLSAADHTREAPATGATGTVPDASLTATISAIEALQRDVLQATHPDGRVDPSGRTLAALNRAIPVPTATARAAIGTTLGGITETVTRGVTVTGRVGDVPAATVTAGTANLPADVSAVQTRLVQLGYLAAGHGEAPAAGATAAIPVASLRHTIDAIRRFQTREVDFWQQRHEITGTVTRGVVGPGDATQQLLDRISSVREQFTTGEDIRFRDFVRSGVTASTAGTSVSGIASPSALPVSEFTGVGLTTQQANALRFVSQHEGNFDALNTFDRARVSFGFIQFAGGRGLPPLMALLKSRNPTAFARMFQSFGIDVEFNVTASGNIENASLVVVDPASGHTLRGTAAESFIRDSHRLSAVFIRAGRDADVQRTQIEAATRDFVLPSLGASARLDANVVEVLSAPGGTVTATHVGAAARAFRASPGFATLRAAGRIRERTATTSAALGTLLTSEQGMATLMDRAIQEGAGAHGGGVVRLVGAIRWVADHLGLADVSLVAGHEHDVLQQVVEDLTADIDIADHLQAATDALNALHTAARAHGATVATVVAMSEASTARTEVDAAIAEVPSKSFTTGRTHLETGLPPERSRLNFTPPPASVGALATEIQHIRSRLNALEPNAGNARMFRQRTRDILSSSLTAPGATATPTPVPTRTPTPTPVPSGTP
ncbi:MAG TPA: DUF4157 domain-containing protein [Chloroflexota bacterium]|nr:DUF4157 domain-containing protein [Chloroflexota bacterium]